MFAKGKQVDNKGREREPPKARKREQRDLEQRICLSCKFAQGGHSRPGGGQGRGRRPKIIRKSREKENNHQS